ncbi:hypothetical protein H8356DRAFT_1298189 [Neocallimastix lanati (nom. inval.)]|jgi:hypothetical protein|uniref:Phospholipase A2 domain-containing protein n=1 Tax=Neocallimastix californiae TaxID=1754190 RepID=A0A1Y1ZIF1_9FUNG|nr:hypothetical protein H8356DRAFT_1298189 [Neocallimastix sp. JGI-2020a]ORY10022.1 hypothetical protein LY90DRAFT_678048 [Neocallimastix californiae]|eukprot:ORY10022.1 hypothetical protein LY90DRAFT_678048 [Neocallimastix californiae]
MYFKSTYISTLLITLPCVLAAVNGKCSSGNGVCISTTSCISSGGSYVRGLCPNDASNVECCNKKCSYNGKSGQCKFINQCNGSSYTDLCPGGSDFACCIDSSSNTNYSSCTTNNGLKGTCIDISQCNGHIYSGYCSGASNIQCCVSLSKRTVIKYITITKKLRITDKHSITTLKHSSTTKKHITTINSKTTTKKSTTTTKSKTTTKKSTTTTKSKTTTKKSTKSKTTTKKSTKSKTTTKKSTTTINSKTTNKKNTITTSKSITTTKKRTTTSKKSTTTIKKSTISSKKNTTTSKHTTTTKVITTTKNKNSTPTIINNKFVKLLTTTNDCDDPIILERNQKFMGLTMVKYMKDTTQKNALSRVDGCSIHKNLNYFLKSLSQSNVDFEPYFTPACNAHDVCYGCGNNKKTCDDKFYENMLIICSEINTTYKSGSMTTSCKEQAYWYYWGVKNFGQSSYDNDHHFVTNNKNTCDYCMNSSNLIYTMFLVEGNTIF